MIGPPIAVDARCPSVVVNGIAGDRMTIACNRDDVRRIFLAVKVNHQPRDIAKDARTAEPMAERSPQFRNTDVDGDVLVKQGGRDAQINIFRHAIGCVVGNQKQGASIGAGNVQPSFVIHQFLLPASTANVTICFTIGRRSP